MSHVRNLFRSKNEGEERTFVSTHSGNRRVLVGVGYHPPPRFHPGDFRHVCGYRLSLLEEHAEREEEEKDCYYREHEYDRRVIRVASQMRRRDV
jgi:hypothetical protein